ncbi:MAG: glycosyltransferase family protein [Lachnoclostridium sp.]|nr:glycosyltransferase family protein [Lachnoclostridium sp.]MCM1534411.1 glycosyltransferase family protein [Clostridium sp.]
MQILHRAVKCACGGVVTLLAVQEAKSMTSGYNEAMKSSDAKYKVYLHQDVFIVNKNFIYDILACFQSEPSLGMLGVVGVEHLLNTADAWESLDVGRCYAVGTFSELGNVAVALERNNPSDVFGEVEFIDGMLMATAYDQDWDERIEGFHFYDVAQSIHFRKQGYKVAIARQDDIWCIHDSGPLNFDTYNRNKQKFLELYTEYSYKNGNKQNGAKIYQLCDTIVASLKSLFEQRQYEKIRNVLTEIGNAIYFNQELLIMYYIMEIRILEKLMGLDLFVNGEFTDETYKCLKKKYLKLKWTLMRVAFAYESAECIADMIVAERYSMAAVVVVMLHNIPQENMYRLDVIGEILSQKGFIQGNEWEEFVLMIEEYEKENMPSAEEL